MPEEGPAQQVPDDVPDAREGAAREGVRRDLKIARRRIAKQHQRGERDAAASRRIGK
jgi:hypothetical protein